jgi:phage-related protein
MLHLSVFTKVTEFIHSLPDEEQAKIASRIDSVRDRDFESAYVKMIRGPIKELIVKDRRIIFCIERDTMYVFHAFTKKTAKTPLKEIARSEHLYALLLRQLPVNR